VTDAPSDRRPCARRHGRGYRGAKLRTCVPVTPGRRVLSGGERSGALQCAAAAGCAAAGQRRGSALLRNRTSSTCCARPPRRVGKSHWYTGGTVRRTSRILDGVPACANLAFNRKLTAITPPPIANYRDRRIAASSFKTGRPLGASAMRSDLLHGVAEA